VGESLSLQGYDNPSALTSPDGEALSFEEQRAFIPQSPGIYTLTTERGVYPLAANVTLGESIPAQGEAAASAGYEVLRADITGIPLWPEVALAALLLLLAEGAIYQGWTLRRR